MSVEFRVSPVVLEGEYVRLEPLSASHAQDLAEHAEPGLFVYFTGVTPTAQTPEGVQFFIDACNADSHRVPFAIIDRSTGKAVGSSSYMDIRAEHRGLEIGTTWLARGAQGTKINPDCKLLLVGHAIETLGAVRVQLKTDLRNLQSQRAIEKLGAKKEGVLRNHSIMPDGHLRDTVMYSIVPEEWPAVRAGLLKRLRA